MHTVYLIHPSFKLDVFFCRSCSIFYVKGRNIFIVVIVNSRKCRKNDDDKSVPFKYSQCYAAAMWNALKAFPTIFTLLMHILALSSKIACLVYQVTYFARKRVKHQRIIIFIKLLNSQNRMVKCIIIFYQLSGLYSFF